GLGCYVGCMIETSLGTAAYLHVALAAAPVTWGCELFGPLLLQGDVVRRPVKYAEGAILALDGPGLGVDVDEAALKEWSRDQLVEDTMTRRLWMCILMITLVGAGLPGSASAQKPVKIGVLTPLSPPGDAIAGQFIVRGAKMAVEEINGRGG